MFETATDMTNEKEITSTLKVQNPWSSRTDYIVHSSPLRKQRHEKRN